MFRLAKYSLPFIAVAAASASARAEVPNIVIYGLRSPVPINQIASSVTVITEEDIAREHKPTVVELLRKVPGVSVPNSGGFGQTSRVFIRGTNSNHVLVVMDGVAVNDPSDPGDAFDFSNLTTDNIERIEVLRGPQSTLYGSQALGGVINIISKKGRGAPGYNAFAEYGRYNSSKVGGGVSGETGNTSYSFSAANSHTNGISAFDKAFGGQEKDGSNTYTFSGNLASRLTESFTAKLVARYNRLVADFDSPGSVAIGGLRPDDDVYPNSDSRQFNIRASGEVSLLDGKWTQEFGLSTLNLNRALITEDFFVFPPSFGRQQYKGRRDTLDWIHRLALIPNHFVTLGGEIATDYYSKTGSSQVDVDHRALFIDDKYTVWNNFFVNYGMRLDSHQSFGREFTWKVAPGYTVRPTGTLLKATYGTGFKAPSLAQLNDPLSGNPNLNPERSKGWDFGFEQPLWRDKATVGMTFFRNDITDLIGFGPAPDYDTLNIGKARTEGVEATVSLQPVQALTLNANYTYSLAQNRVKDVDLTRRPHHQANLSAVYRFASAWDAGVDVRYVGASQDIYYASPTGTDVITLPSFATVGLTANYAFTTATTLYTRVDNLLNKHYEEISGYGQPGVSLFGGIKTRF